ncbi:unnamed protein product, partial [Cuscuta epithymum]
MGPSGSANDVVHKSAKNLKVPSLSPLVDSSRFPSKMKLTIKSSLTAFKDEMKYLRDFPDLISEFRECVFGRYLDVNFIPPPTLLWPLLSRIAKTETDSEQWFVLKGVPVRYSITEFALISGLNCGTLNVDNYEDDF